MLMVQLKYVPYKRVPQGLVLGPLWLFANYSDDRNEKMLGPRISLLCSATYSEAGAPSLALHH